jgi:hypothetical protein
VVRRAAAVVVAAAGAGKARVLRYTIDPHAEIEMTQQKKDQQTLRSELTDEQYRVTQERGTEPAFTGKYWDML